VGGGLLAFWAWSIATLRYRLTDDALTVRWGLTEHVIPLAGIAALLPAPAAGGPLRSQGVSWPGCHLGRAWTPGLGEVVLASAHLHAHELVFVSAGSVTYGLSVADAEQFAAEVRKRQMQAVPSLLTLPEVRQPRLFGLSLWRDRPGLLLLGLGLLANAALFAYVCFVYPDLPTFLPFQVTPEGAAGEIGQREELLLLPGAALGVLVVNAAVGAMLHRWERLGAYLCLGAATLVQVFVGAAVVRIIG
jgi:hypothetical protein